MRKLSEVVLCSLVGDELLTADEEEVLEAVVEWIKGGGSEEGRGGERLLGLIRYGLLTASRLAEVGLRAEEMVGGRLGARLRAFANEALAAQQVPAVEQVLPVGLLCSRAFKVREGMDVAWVEYAEGRRQHRHVWKRGRALTLCWSGGSVFGGLMDGSLFELDPSTLEERQLLKCAGHVGYLECVTACGDLVT